MIDLFRSITKITLEHFLTARTPARATASQLTSFSCELPLPSAQTLVCDETMFQNWLFERNPCQLIEWATVESALSRVGSYEQCRGRVAGRALIDRARLERFVSEADSLVLPEE